MKKPWIAVELDSPSTGRETEGGAGAYGAYLERVRFLAASGANAITIADNPLASPRSDSALLAAAVTRETGISVMPHLACRDRNRNALLSGLLALDLLGVREVLAVTGDPVREQDRAAVKSLAAFDSIGFIRLIGEWNERLFSRPFSVSAALNVNAQNFNLELDRAKRKEDSGASRFLTQPVFCESALRNLERARSALGGELIAGILPVVSAKNARFLAERVSGIGLDPAIERRLEGADRETAAEIAAETALETAQAALARSDGLYLVTPFTRVDIIATILGGLTRAERAREQALRPLYSA